ncbi:hypothetical protein DTO212C5_3295 [Paecilomyces variotii]|nr:hypothetical protein DTO169E5_750 [Paecilomyces variotii]KAJ9270506.1 hypothetical protein DTO212C5_3295 [Paecilomyces variotii]KAJ9409643.1 hypothetical protein DTO045G8_2569 [Paecilomyces variotii]
MAPAASSSTGTAVLQAQYSSPHPPTSHTFQHHLSSTLNVSAAPEENVKTKTEYLSELKGLVTKLQGEINVFLTERMEEDKKAAEAQGKKESEKEAKEEENYGEEVVEDE